MSSINSLCVLVTCYNRKLKTLACLRSLEASAALCSVQLRGVLVDDGSNDGTSDAVRFEFPWMVVLSASGNLFWNRGMHMAMAHALRNIPCDAFLWLNDDTNLDPSALSLLIETAHKLVASNGRTGLVVGSTRDPMTGELTYGGSVSVSKLRRFAYKKVFDAQRAVPCQAINGNVVLIPAAVAADVGNLDPVFEHAMGDTDYGLRALQRNWPVVVAPGFVGICGRNPVTGSFLDPALGRAARLRHLTSRKGLPPRSWAHLCRRHGGWHWPLLFVWPYARVLFGKAPAALR